MCVQAGRLLLPGHVLRDRADFWLGTAADTGGLLLRWLAAAVPELQLPRITSSEGGTGAASSCRREYTQALFRLPLARRVLASYAANDWQGLSEVLISAIPQASAAAAGAAAADGAGGGSGDSSSNEHGSSSSFSPPLRWVDLGGGSGDALVAACESHPGRIEGTLFEIPEARTFFSPACRRRMAVRGIRLLWRRPDRSLFTHIHRRLCCTGVRGRWSRR